MLPSEKGGSDKFQLYDGKDIVVGIRPEEMTVDVNPEVNEISIDGEVEISEMLGAEAYMYIKCSCSEKSITVRVPAGKHTAPGTKVKLVIDLNKIHLFDELTEATICN